jgi:PEP-CTERM motif
LVLDVQGKSSGLYSQMIVSGHGVFDGPIDVNFAGYAPRTGDSYDFISVAGGADFSGATVDILGLAPGFQYSDTFSNGGFDLEALNNGVLAPVPEPSTLALMGSGMLGLGWFWRRRREA